MSSEEDIVIPSKLLKKKTPAPTSPTADLLHKDSANVKTSTKEMVNAALKDLKSRKGVSYYAIKKYINEKYHTDSKINYFIKKYLKICVEKGTVVQVKGVGAAGSFNLVTEKKKTVPKKEKITITKVKINKEDKPEKKKADKKVKLVKKKEVSPIKEKLEKKKKKIKSQVIKKKIVKEKEDKVLLTPIEEKVNKSPKKKTKMSPKKNVKKSSPKNKAVALKKRKSIGSIIKAPKMKPTSK